MNISDKIDTISNSLAELSAYVMGHGGKRPWHNPYNLTSYILWFVGLTEEEKEAECELLRRGFYKWESVSTMEYCKDAKGKQIHAGDIATMTEAVVKTRRKKMFECRDANGTQIHIDDVGETVEDIEEIKMGDQIVVMAILSEEEVQVNPTNAGLPQIVHPTSISVTYSFVEKLKDLSSDEDLQEILRRAEARFLEERPKKKGKKVKFEEGELELDF